MNAAIIAGLDAAYESSETAGSDGARASRCWGAAVLWDRRSGAVLEEVAVEGRAGFPYVPGFLALREMPVLLEALARLSRRPEILLCDGHGRAHPRRSGLACRLEEAAGLPAIGCAKRRLVGVFEQPGPAAGSRSALTDRGERVGTVLRTRASTRPIFISVGGRIELDEAEMLVMACIRSSRIPEPLALAHRLATRAARERS
jgi:deoxyribonuclease V